MASIIKQLNKKTGVTYVYESESYWDKEKRQPRSRRRLIGKIDDETGEIIPTGKSGRKKRNTLTFPKPSTLIETWRLYAWNRKNSSARMPWK